MVRVNKETRTRLVKKLKGLVRKSPVGKSDWLDNLTDLLPNKERFRPKIKISLAQLQAQLERNFPIEKPFWQRFWVQLHHPRLQLHPDSNRLTLGCQVSIQLQGEAGSSELVQGMIDLSSGVVYKAEEGRFYLHHPAIHSIEIQGLPYPVTLRAKDMINTLIMGKLTELPVYELSADERHHLALKRVLKDIVIGEEEITLYLGMPT